MQNMNYDIYVLDLKCEIGSELEIMVIAIGSFSAGGHKARSLL